VNDDVNYAFMLGGITQTKGPDFLEPDGGILDHEIDYRLQHFNTYWFDDGIFSGAPMTNFNREHLLLLRLLRVSMEALDLSGHTKNDLIAFDYVRPV
jgi:hypothetical protein